MNYIVHECCCTCSAVSVLVPVLQDMMYTRLPGSPGGSDCEELMP